MKHNRTHRLPLFPRATFLWLMGAMLASQLAQAQSEPAPAATPQPGLRNAVRIDLGGILTRNVAYNALNYDNRFLLPILVGYERQVGQRTSGSIEALVNGGSPNERLTGLALQGRYYAFQGKQTGLAGLYVAPTMSYRAVRQTFGYEVDYKSKLGGVGALLGAQCPIGASGRLLLDIAGGVMTWKRLDARPTAGQEYHSTETFYERNETVFDGRLSLGYRF
ncbi:hypothetical protein FY528_10950 [Hymenobacter lutimineralis]|uniref:DUF3575 domain-containing protein n=1 Tax=Hymenobacter lutimineralis TaxID=2606448 RepID=A0A5D6V133_9BACT|nr:MULTISPECIES: hypothetical protein [Hymenobacter]QIX61713.1 hypothetical protein HER32_11200 [Hymenobacter sp. BT18]TYZ09256.1 hypothetical protein FY528_10950 [Hymenobacter lutimineralis]